MSEQIIAYGASVKRSTDGVTFTSIPECKGIAIPAVEQDYVDVTNLDSPNGYREFIKGMKDAGSITVPCGYTAEGVEQQLADQEAADAIYYEVILRKQPSQTVVGDKFEFRGFPVVQFTNGGAAELVEMEIALRITGAVTWTKGS